MKIFFAKKKKKNVESEPKKNGILKLLSIYATSVGQIMEPKTLRNEFK